MESYPIEEALEMAKNFTAPRRKKISSDARPSLRGAWVDEEYVWATDSNALIRIKHNQQIAAPYLHGYKLEDAEFFSSGNTTYPSVKSIIPDASFAKCYFDITEVDEWLLAHELVCTLKSTVPQVTLNTYKKTLNAKNNEKGGYDLSFFYKDLPLSHLCSDAKISYSAAYMVQVLNVAKKWRVPSLRMFIVDNSRPYVLKTKEEGITFVVMPIRASYPGPIKAVNPKKKKVGKR